MRGVDLKACVHEIPTSLGRDAFARVMPVLSLAARSDHKSIRGTHLDLQLLGAKPTRQRQGLRSTPICAIVTRADAESLPGYLQTFEACDMPLHQSRGFTVEEGEPNSAIRGWGLLGALKRGQGQTVRGETDGSLET